MESPGIPGRFIALFGVRLGVEDMSNDVLGGGADALCPADQSLWRPRLMGAMRSGHVLGHGGVAAAQRTAGMTGHAPMVIEDLDGGARDAQLDLLAA
jgi:hypothetical protein